jgi:hypothetical protein
MGGLIVYYQNKCTIKSINSTDSTKARNIKLLQYVDWIGETCNGQEFWICSANLNF